MNGPARIDGTSISCQDRWLAPAERLAHSFPTSEIYLLIALSELNEPQGGR